MVAGNTLIEKSWQLYLAPDGTIFGKSRKQFLLGTWTVKKDGQFCTRYPTARGGAENCYHAIAHDDGLQLRGVDRWTIFEVTVKNGKPEGY